MLGHFWRRPERGDAIDPTVMAAAQVEATLDDLRVSLRAGESERAQQRDVARRVRERAVELVERNHFGESIEKAMMRRGA